MKMNDFAKKILIRQINRYHKKQAILERQTERSYKALGTVEKFDKSQMLGYMISIILTSLFMFGFMALGFYVLIAVYNALGIWFVLGAMFAFGWIKEAVYFFGHMMN